MGVLLRDNDSLRKALGAVTREKAGLCRAATRLERTLAQHLLKGCTLSVRMRLHRAVAWGSAVPLQLALLVLSSLVATAASVPSYWMHCFTPSQVHHTLSPVAPARTGCVAFHLRSASRHCRGDRAEIFWAATLIAIGSIIISKGSP